jgi:hypothetical protein
MPSKSKQQQKFMGYELSKQRKTGKNDTGMSENQLEDFASTKRKGLPSKVKPKRKKAK